MSTKTTKMEKTTKTVDTETNNLFTSFWRYVRCAVGEHPLVSTQRLPFKAVRSQCPCCKRIFVTEKLDETKPIVVTTLWDEQDHENYVAMGATIRYTAAERQQLFKIKLKQRG